MRKPREIENNRTDLGWRLMMSRGTASLDGLLHKRARKTGQPRRIRIGRELGELLVQAVAERQTGPVFLSPAGKAWTVPNLSRTYSRLRDLAGLRRDLVLYLAQHECGTKICREKGIEYARRLLGHANMSTTQRYMHLDDRDLAEAQDLVE
ncbi:MAG: tyrosine-type recombinase/integrase [Deltaproteobacteria bacterium]